MAGSAVTKDEHRTYRRRELIPDGQTLESIVAHQLVTRL